MDDFDRFLERQLRNMLDAVVATPAPVRRSRRTGAPQPISAVEAPVVPAASGAAASESISVLKPMAVTAPIAFPLV